MKLPTPIQSLSHPLLDGHKIHLSVKRDDLIDKEIMGNKWRKLKYNLLEAKSKSCTGLITVGGAYSNHIAATAAAADRNGLKSIAFIRGDELSFDSNPTLKFASSKGMRLEFISRTKFKELRDDPGSIIKEYTGYYFLPEGGTNQLAIKGTAEIIDEIHDDFDVIVSSVGTGGTLSGLISKVSDNQQVIGISALKGDFIRKEVTNLLNKYVGNNPRNYEINTDYHFGGYARTTCELIEFINWFKENFDIQLDPIYTGKCFFAVWDMIKNSKFEENLRIILLHTGGLQGFEGFNRKNENIIQ